MKSRRVNSVLIGIALVMLVAGCAGPVTQSGPAGLSGMWHGSFTHAGADYTSPSRADLTLEVRDDSTYTFKWGTRADSTGTLVDQGNRVVLRDSSGSQIALSHSGDTLFGVMRDTATGRSTMVSLVKDESTATQAAKAGERLCQAAGGKYSKGVCEPAIDPAVVARQCEERGGVYFAADYCEVPGGGLRPH